MQIKIQQKEITLRKDNNKYYRYRKMGYYTGECKIKRKQKKFIEIREPKEKKSKVIKGNRGS